MKKELLERLKTLKAEVRGLTAENKVEEAENKLEEIRSIKKQLEILEEVEKEDRNTLLNTSAPIVRNIAQQNDSELRSAVKYALGHSMTEEERSAVLIQDNLAAIPEEFVNQLQVLKDGYPSLKPFTHIIPVTSNSGSMPFAKIGHKKLSKLSDGQAIPSSTPSKVEPVKFNVDDYGDITPISNSLKEDEVVDIIKNVITVDFAEAAVNTENSEIISIVEAEKKVVTGEDESIVNGTIDKIVPSLRKGTIVITNTNSLAWGKNLKDKNGQPLNFVKELNGKYYINGREVVELSDTDVTPTTEGNYVFYVVNLFALVKFFERKGMLLSISEHAYFSSNMNALRVIERFDAEKLDARACYKVEIPSTVTA